MPTITPIPNWSLQNTDYTSVEASEANVNGPFFDEYDNKTEHICRVLNAMLGTINETGMLIDSDRRSALNLTGDSTSHVHTVFAESLNVKNGTDISLQGVHQKDINERRDAVYSRALTEFRLPADIVSAISNASGDLISYITEVNSLTALQSSQVAAWTAQINSWNSDTASNTALFSELSSSDVKVLGTTISDPSWVDMDVGNGSYISDDSVTNTRSRTYSGSSYSLQTFNSFSTCEYFDVKIGGIASDLQTQLVLDIQYDSSSFSKSCVIRVIVPSIVTVTIPKITVNIYTKDIGQPDGTPDPNKPWMVYSFYSIAPTGADHVFELGYFDISGSEISARLKS